MRIPVKASCMILPSDASIFCKPTVALRILIAYIRIGTTHKGNTISVTPVSVG